MQSVASLFVMLLVALIVLILLQYHTPDVSLFAAFITLTAAVVDLIRRHRS
jgi:hypothetical protein